MKKVIIFGGSGFIGSHVAEQYVQAGYDVTAVVRPTSDGSFLQGLGVKLVPLTAFTPDAVTQAMRGFDVAVNCTADIHMNHTLEQYRQTQVNLTRELAQAAHRAGVRRFMQLSTVEVYGKLPASAVDETYPPQPIYAFQQSNWEREQTLHEVSARTGLDVVIVRPAGTFGRRSHFLSMMMTAHQCGRFPVLGDGVNQFCAVDTRDIGRAFVFLTEQQRAKGETYLLQSYTTSWSQIKEMLDHISGRRTRMQRLPKRAAFALAAVMEWLTPHDKHPFITRFVVHTSTATHLFDDSKLRALGFTPRYDLQENMRYTLDGYADVAAEQQAMKEAV